MQGIVKLRDENPVSKYLKCIASIQLLCMFLSVFLQYFNNIIRKFMTKALAKSKIYESIWTVKLRLWTILIVSNAFLSNSRNSGLHLFHILSGYRSSQFLCFSNSLHSSINFGRRIFLCCCQRHKNAPNRPLEFDDELCIDINVVYPLFRCVVVPIAVMIREYGEATSRFSIWHIMTNRECCRISTAKWLCRHIRIYIIVGVRPYSINKLFFFSRKLC
jgi:hypothetical protein